MCQEPRTQIGRKTIDGKAYPVVASYYKLADHPGGCDLSKVWCPYCWCWHTHGRADGHRWAHCSVFSSPYSEQGYILKEVGEWTPDLQAYGQGRGYQMRRPIWCRGCQRPIPALYRHHRCPECHRPNAGYTHIPAAQRRVLVGWDG
jgi:hypothetical protein